MKKALALASLIWAVTASAIAGEFYECVKLGGLDQHRVGIYMDGPRAQYFGNGSTHDLTYDGSVDLKDETPPETVMEFRSSYPDFPHFYLHFYTTKKTVSLASTDWQGFLNGNCVLAKPWE